MKAWFIFWLIFFSATSTENKSLRSWFIVWNVGQGQWTTLIHEGICDHYDFGGEKLPLPSVQKLCGDKFNHLHLSHWDQDHWGGLAKLKNRLPDLCHDIWPEHLPSKKLKPWIQKIPLCRHAEIPLYHPGQEWALAKSTQSNDLSQIHLTKGFLIPGDSTQKMEKIWAPGMAQQPVRVLILGHHGSRTSTSDILLQSLPHLKLAIVSARKERFGHPHPEVLRKLARFRIPVLSTQDWGSIVFEL